MSADTDDRAEVQALLVRLRATRPRLQTLLRECSDDAGYEDPVYRFYHQSWKVYRLQEQTGRIVDALAELAPGRVMNDIFLSIVRQGTGKSFELDHNLRWTETTRPILEAFFHARYFLEMAVRYGGELEYPPRLLPSGWAAFLYLYDLR